MLISSIAPRHDLNKLGATLVDCRGNRAEPELRALSPFF